MTTQTLGLKEFCLQILRLVARRPVTYIAGIITVIALDGVDMFPAILVKQLTDELQRQELSRPISHYILALVACYMIIAVLRMGWRIFIMIPSRTIEGELRQEAYRKLLQARHSAVSKMQIGDVVSTLAQDVANVRMFLGPGMLIFFDSIAYLIFIPSTMFYILGWQALWVLLPFTLIASLVIWAQPRLEKYHQDNADVLGDVSNHIYEEAQGVRLFRAEDLAWIRKHKYEVLLKKLLSTQLNIAKLDLALDGTIQAVLYLCYLVVLATAWMGKTQAALEIGYLTVTLQLVDKLIWPVMSVNYLMNLGQSAAAGMRRLKDIHDMPDRQSGSVELPTKKLTAIELKNLTLEVDQQKVLLNNINAQFLAGERIALVGKVGSGKSTLLKAIAGLYDAREFKNGTLHYNSIPLADLWLPDLWHTLSYIPQVPQIFGLSLKKNIAPHLPFEDQRFLDALESADLAQDVASFPLGLSTLIGEKGLNLSGGQKQRTTIARSFYSGASLFLWDDAISALDPATERKIIYRLRELSSTSTLILATHRLSALKEFDRILVMDEGKIVDEGSWMQLATHSPIFQELLRDEEKLAAKESTWT